jgi:long-subunit acyl-CoA synthetase (AMP-forming)
LSFYIRILFSVLFRPVRAILGGRIRFILAGGAPLAPETHRCLRAALCCPVLQGYGLTETCSATTMMDMDDRSTGIFVMSAKYNQESYYNFNYRYDGRAVKLL